MRTRRGASIEDLRRAIDCLPNRTKIAMLHGMDTNPIIVGAYSTSEGICPMLAAHRAGGRTDLIAFARAWDRVAFGSRRRAKSRRATRRELLILRSHLEASLLADERPLAAAIAEHQALTATRSAARAKPQHKPKPRAGNSDRTRELRASPGWAWTRLFRRYDDYARTLGQLAETELRLEHEDAHERDPAPQAALR